MNEPSQKPSESAKRIINSASPDDVLRLTGPSAQRTDALAKDMRSKLQTLGLETAWRLNKHDLALATLNAGSESVAYTLPAPPSSFSELASEFSANFPGDILPRKDSLLVRADTNWLLFKHVIWYAITTGQLPQDNIVAAKQVGFVPIRPEVYTSYLDTLQAATRIIEGNLPAFIESGAWLAAETNARHSGRPLGAPSPYISITGCDADGITFSICGANEFKIQSQTGGATLIAGAGYSTVTYINILSKISNRTFIINDNDPLTAALWSYHLQLDEKQNIRFVGGDFGRLNLKAEALDTVVISDTPSADPRSLYNLFRSARNFPGCTILSLQRLSSDEGIFSAEKMRDAVDAFGFTAIYRQEYKIRSHQLTPSKQLRSMDGAEAEALLKDPPQPEARRYELLVAKVGR